MTVISTYSTHSNTTPSPPLAKQNCSSATQILGPIASRAFLLYCECLVNSSPARFVLQTKRGSQQLSFTCRDIPAGFTAVNKNLSRRRPANPRRFEKKRERRAEWLEGENLLYNLAPSQLPNQKQQQQ
jgi:hypothetical protein